MQTISLVGNQRPTSFAHLKAFYPRLLPPAKGLRRAVGRVLQANSPPKLRLQV